MSDKKIVKLEVKIKQPSTPQTTKVTQKSDGLKFLDGSTNSFNKKGGAK